MHKSNNLGAIAAFMAGYTHDPLGFVYAAFPWGQGPLKGMEPESWQKKLLNDIGHKLKTPGEVIREAVASGHGIGKSALVAWLILWAMATHEDTRGVVTANTDTQLKTKTWPELIKWHNRFIGKGLFQVSATSIYSTQEGHDKTWRVDAIPWSDTNPEAFAGLHNQGKRILLVMDEASAIPDMIWEVAEGAMTDKGTEILWGVFGNPTRNNGRFFDCFHKNRGYWETQQVDSRTVSFANTDQMSQWIKQYGEDSDFCKIRIYGQFPNSSENQFISTEIASRARGRQLRREQFDFAPVIIGCDPSWTGADATAIVLRQGLMSKILGVIPKNDNDFLIAQLLAQHEDTYHADGVMIDLGYGTGIYSAGKTMGRNWQLVSFAEKSPKAGYLNMRAYMWGMMREWLKTGAYQDNQQLYDDITGPEAKPRPDGIIQLESKAEMKKRGLASPNIGDALALTFARPIVKRNPMADKNGMVFTQKYHAYQNLRRD